MSLLLLFGNGESSGVGSFNDNISLFIQGATASESNNNCTLYIDGVTGTQYTNTCTLFTKGHGSITSNATLFINGVFIENSNTTLYINGILQSNEGMNLFCQAEDIPTNSLDLFISGITSGVTAWANTAPLFIAGETLYASLNLFIQGELTALFNNSLNMYIGGNQQERDGYITLFCLNDSPFNTATLFIQGEGVGDGGLPASGSLNLFIDRNTADAITLFVNAQPPLSDTITLFCAGANQINDGITLAMANVIGLYNKAITLYSHGF